MKIFSGLLSPIKEINGDKWRSFHIYVSDKKKRKGVNGNRFIIMSPIKGKGKKLMEIISYLCLR